MACKVRYSPMAIKDMDEIWDGVLKVSCDYDTADRYVNDLADEIAKKKTAPRAGIPLYYRGLFTGFYSVNFKAYKAFYRIIDNHIEVIRVLLAKMDYLKVLFGSQTDGSQG